MCIITLRNTTIQTKIPIKTLKVFRINTNVRCFKEAHIWLRWFEPQKWNRFMFYTKIRLQAFSSLPREWTKMFAQHEPSASFTYISSIYGFQWWDGCKTALRQERNFRSNFFVRVIVWTYLHQENTQRNKKLEGSCNRGRQIYWNIFLRWWEVVWNVTKKNSQKELQTKY